MIVPARVAELVDAMVSKTIELCSCRFGSGLGYCIGCFFWKQPFFLQKKPDENSEMSYYVYVLYSAEKDIFYRGQTNDIKDRLQRHNSGYVKSTSFGKPWKLIWFTEKESRSEALALEKKLKNLSRKKLILFMKKYSQYCAGPDAMSFLAHWSGC